MHVAACVEESEDMCRSVIRSCVRVACLRKTVTRTRSHWYSTHIPRGHTSKDGPAHDSYGTRSCRSDRNRRPTGAMAWLWHPSSSGEPSALGAESPQGPFGCNGAMVKRCWRRRATSSLPHIRLLAHCARYSWPPATRPIRATVRRMSGHAHYTRHHRLFVPNLCPAIGSATARRNQPSRRPHYVGR